MSYTKRWQAITISIQFLDEFECFFTKHFLKRMKLNILKCTFTCNNKLSKNISGKNLTDCITRQF